MGSINRDNFSKSVKQLLANQAGNCCSFEGCPQPTSGPTSDGKHAHNGGDAAHIASALPGGRRFDPNMTPAQRRSPSNGIWLCTFHHRIIDGPDDIYTSDELHRMKKARLNVASKELLYGRLNNGIPTEQKCIKPSVGIAPFELIQRSAKSDLRRLKDSKEWPPTKVPISLSGFGRTGSFTSQEAARLFRGARHLTLSAAPGFGKTSALLQMLEAAQEDATIAAIHVSLPHWALRRESIFTHILERRAFHDVQIETITAALNSGKIWFILDGWNELGDEGRQRAIVAIENLQADWPELMMMVATRTDAGSVPIDSAELSVLPLSRDQQEEIAQVMLPNLGSARLATARKQVDLAALLEIPLYLRALLSLPSEVDIPQSRERLMFHMAQAQNMSKLREDQVRTRLDGQAVAYMEALATCGLNAGQTAISDSQALEAVTVCAKGLEADGQISTRPSPRIVLDTLTGHMGLLSHPNNDGYSFDHHQFQEWYGSHAAEAIFRSAYAKPKKKPALRILLNKRGWSEALLFATDRLFAGDTSSRLVLASATKTAFWVDPNLCATWIRRHGELLWLDICNDLKPHLDRWRSQDWQSWLTFAAHAAVPQLAPEVVDLLRENPEVAPFRLMSNSRSLRAVVFGQNPKATVDSLPEKVREHILLEFAAGTDEKGLDMALEAALASDDPDFRLRVLDYLLWRGPLVRASRLIRESDDDVVTRFVGHNWPDETLSGLDADVVDRLNNSRATYLASSHSPQDLLWRWANSVGRRAIARGDQQAIGDIDPETVTALVIAIDLSNDNSSKQEAETRRNKGEQAIRNAFERSPDAVRQGLIERLRSGSAVPFRVHALLDDPSIVVDAHWVGAKLRKAGPSHHPDSSALAALLSVKAVAELLADTVQAYSEVLTHSQPLPEQLRNRWRVLEGRISFAQPERLAYVVREAVNALPIKQLGRLSSILSRPETGRSYGVEAQGHIQETFKIATRRVLDEAPNDRRLLTDVAKIAAIVPRADSLPLVQKLAEADSKQLQKFADEVERDGVNYHLSRRTRAWNETRWPYEGEFGRVFAILPGPGVRSAMKSYLRHPRLGPMAARTLMLRWLADNEPDNRQMPLGDDLERARHNRELFAAGDTSNCEEAAWIFLAVEERWKVLGNDREEIGRVFDMVQSGARLPHGSNWIFIQRLVEAAHVKTAGNILQMVGWSGRSLPTDMINKGVSKLILEAQTHTWMLTDDWTGQQWLRLCALSDNPHVIFDVIDALPERFKMLDQMKTFVQWLGALTPSQGDLVLDKLANLEPEWLRNYDWVKAAKNFNSVVLNERIANAALSGQTDPGHYQGDPSIAHLQALVVDDPNIQSKFLNALSSSDASVRERAASKLVWSGNPELFLATLDVADQLNDFPASWRLVSSLVSRRQIDPNWENSYIEVPIDASRFRAELLKRIYTASEKVAGIALSILREIDSIRGESGAPSNEPRHPDLELERPWPIIDREITAIQY